MVYKEKKTNTTAGRGRAEGRRGTREKWKKNSEKVVV